MVPLDVWMEAALQVAETPDLVLLPSISRPDDDLEVRGVGGLEEPYALDTDLMDPGPKDQQWKKKPYVW